MFWSTFVAPNAETSTDLPPTTAFANRNGVTAATSGNCRDPLATDGLRPPMPNCVSTIQLLFIAVSIDVEIDDFAEAANTVISETRATPIISADAVADVRRGLRIAFSRASVPAMPRTRGSGAPTTRVNRRAMTGPSNVTPRNTSERTETDRSDATAGTRQSLRDQARTD